MSLAQTANIERLHQILVNGNKRQKRDLLPLLAEEGLTEQDLATKSEKARNTPDLNIRALIFAVS
jgi:hypothetical protein